MPLKRTPPKSPASNLHHHHSESDLPAASMTSASIEVGNVTQRAKRRREDEIQVLSENLNTFMSTIKDMFSDMKSEQEKKYCALHNSIADIKTQNSELQKSVDFMSAKYDDVLSKLDTLQSECNTQREHISALEYKVEFLERNSLSTSVELRNVPKRIPENMESLSSVTKQLGVVLNVPIQNSDIREVYRTKGKAESDGPIVVNFTTIAKKENIIKSVRNFNKEHKDNKFNTSHLDIVGPPRPVYITEHLTRKSKRLHFLSRNFATEFGYAHCWTSYGKIFLRKKDGLPRVRIDCEDDLNKLKQIK